MIGRSNLWLLAGLVLAGAFIIGIRKMIKNNDIDLMARTMLGEARGEGRRGMIAVGHAIKNRAHRGLWWGDSIAQVIMKPQQFSAWNKGDPNRDYMQNLTRRDSAFVESLLLAEGILDGSIADPTGGATHYHTKAVSPYWADASKLTADLGSHVFYKGIA